MAAKRYTWTVQITIDPVWVADGFNITNERAHDIIAHALPHANGHEFSAKVLSAPDPMQIKCEQGTAVEGYAPFMKD